MQGRVGSVLQHHDRRARGRPRAEAPKRLRLAKPRKLLLVVHAPLQAVPELRGVVQVSRLPRPPQSGGHGGALPPRQGQVRIGGTIRTVARVVVHTSFKQASLQNDVALLVLDKPFKMDKAGIVCVPPPGSLFDGNNCTATTRTSEEDGSLRMIRLPMVSRDECVDLLRKTRLGGYFQLHQSFICAGSGADQDTCGGDEICAVPGVPGRFQQVGIVSWGIGCGGNLPGVYVNLAHFREWIDEVMTENGLDISTYRL
jgi:hypothetical protein